MITFQFLVTYDESLFMMPLAKYWSHVVRDEKGGTNAEY